MDNARELFEHELRDMYDAEQKLTRALESMAKKTTNPELTKGFQDHLTVTKDQAGRLEQVFSLIDRKARREPCDGINGLISEFTSFAKEGPSKEVLDLFATSAALKVEHYEIVGYKSLIKLADHLGLSDAAELLEQSLREEQETAQELEQLSEKLGQEVPTG